MPFYKRTKDKEIEMSFMYIIIFSRNQTGLNRSASWSVIPIQGPRDQGEGLKGLRGSRGRPKGSQGLKVYANWVPTPSGIWSHIYVLNCRAKSRKRVFSESNFLFKGDVCVVPWEPPPPGKVIFREGQKQGKVLNFVNFVLKGMFRAGKPTFYTKIHFLG